MTRDEKENHEVSNHLTASDGLLFLAIAWLSLIVRLGIRACSLKLAWGWFVRPVFQNVPAIDLRAAIGIIVFLSAMFATRKIQDDDVQMRGKEKEWADTKKKIVAGIMIEMFYLSLIAIAHWTLH